MKIAIYHPFPNSAESEVAQRYILAGKKLGIEIFETGNPSEIEIKKPDFTLSLSIFSPKAFSVPSYHVLNNPAQYYLTELNEEGGYSKLTKALLTHDGYLGISEKMKAFMQKLALDTGKKFLYEDGFVNTLGSTPFYKVDFSKSNLAYFGSNWDKNEGEGYRFEDIFNNLIKTNTSIKFYGSKKSWKHIPSKFYGGAIPFDGISVLQKYREACIGLALNKKNFFEYNLPTSRIFEITASSAIGISDKMPFVVDEFKDTVLYVENNNDSKNTAMQIREHIEWIKENPQKAIEMAFEANKIFNEKFSTEIMLKKAIKFHENASKKSFYTETFKFIDKQPLVSIVIKTDGKDKEALENTINSIANQSYKRIELIIFLRQPCKEVEDLSLKYKEKFENIQVIESPVALKYIKGEYLGFLDESNIIFPNHISTLLEGFSSASAKDSNILYAGSFDYYNIDFSKNARKKLLKHNLESDVCSAIRVKNNLTMCQFEKLNEQKFSFDNIPTCLIKVSALKSLDQLAIKENLKFIPEVTSRQNKNLPHTLIKKLTKLLFL